MTRPQASVVILTFNQSTLVEKAIDALQRQKTNYVFEIIVADDGSKEEHLEVMRNKTTVQGGENIKLITQEDLGYRAAKARNNGIKIAEGDVIILFDGDMVPNNGFIDNHMDMHHTLSKPLLCFGTRNWKDIVELTDGTTSAEMTEWHQRNERNEKTIREKLILDGHAWHAAFSCNLSFTKSSISYFDETFEGYGMEDIEFAYRMHKHGYHVRSAPTASATQYMDSVASKNPFRTQKQDDIRFFIKNCIRIMDMYPTDAYLNCSVAEQLARFSYAQQNRTFEKIPREQRRTVSSLNEASTLKEKYRQLIASPIIKFPTPGL